MQPLDEDWSLLLGLLPAEWQNQAVLSGACERLRGLCVSLLQENGWEVPAEARGFNVRALDGTLVKEPGRSGSLWRIHYSVRIPSLVCDHFELTATKGRGTGETMGRFAA